MKNNLVAVILLLNIFIPLSYAGMEQTNACNNKINNLNMQINALSTQISSTFESIEIKKNKVSDLQKEIDAFSSLPLLPRGIIRWKTGSQKEEIIKLEEEISQQESLLKEKNVKKTQLSNELSYEKGRLRQYRSVVIKYIRISSSGTWDTFAEPEIYITMGDTRIARGNENSSSFSSTFDINTGGADGYNSLYVYDEDMTDFEYMGEINLLKHQITPQYGVPGDSQKLSFNGSSGSNQGNINYTVEYEVFY